MSDDILDRIDDTLTFYSAGLLAELTVPVESRHRTLEAVAVVNEVTVYLLRGSVRWPWSEDLP